MDMPLSLEVVNPGVFFLKSLLYRNSRAPLLPAKIVKAMTFHSHFLTVVIDTGRLLLNRRKILPPVGTPS
jgi:hypothetical protein